MEQFRNLFFQTSTKTDGNMSPLYGDEPVVQANQQRWLTALGLKSEQLCLMTCDHGDKIIAVTSDDFVAGKRPNAEALMTNDPEIILGLLTADCIPAVFFDPVTKSIALAHLNRKTIAHDLALKVVDAMKTTYGGEPSNLLVHFEPHIHKTSYVFDLPLETIPPQLAPHISEVGGQAYVDFQAAHTEQLVASGVPIGHINSHPVNVGTDTHYFSYYRQKRSPAEIAGRHLTVVTLQSE